jgi:hypothetical protein
VALVLGLVVSSGGLLWALLALLHSTGDKRMPDHHHINNFRPSSNLLIPTLEQQQLRHGFVVQRQTAEEGLGNLQNNYSETRRGDNETAQNTITLLLSFPNSGTSYTIQNTMAISQLSTATNYATEMAHQKLDTSDLQLVPIQAAESVPGSPPRPDAALNGPWKFNDKLPLPPSRVLCKTHCGGYDDNASVAHSVLTSDAFQKKCTETLQKKDKAIPDLYHNVLRRNYEMDGLVDSALHLIRDPFDNVVSRFHLALKHQQMGIRLWDEAQHEAGAQPVEQGIQKWCDGIDALFWNVEETSTIWNDRSQLASYIPEETLALLPYNPIPYLHIPCHGEFFRYAQWHDLAMKLIDQKKLPVLVVHYETYETNYNRTVKQIMKFLEQEWVHSPIPFQTGKTYRDVYFTADQQDSVKAMIKEIVEPATWKALRGYFSRSSTNSMESNL